jgi:hypothetical protein
VTRPLVAPPSRNAPQRARPLFAKCFIPWACALSGYRGTHVQYSINQMAGDHSGDKDAAELRNR